MKCLWCLWCVLLVVGTATFCRAAETLEVFGLITAGRSLGSGLAGNNPAVPQNITSPLPYVGRLTYQPEIDDARFRFVLDPDGFDVGHVIGFGLNGENFFPAVDQFDADRVQIDYRPPFGSPIPILEFALNRATGVGEWEWNEWCGGCRAILPQATATITSYRVVPEPSVVAWSMVLAALSGWQYRRRRGGLPVR